MQTFLPWSSFIASAQVLDRHRLGKQRVENWQIMRTLLEGRGWIHHPVTKQWEGYEWLLMQYQYAICDEWVSRGYEDNMLKATEELYRKHNPPISEELPPWLGDVKYHHDMRVRLLRKNWKHYSQFFPEAKLGASPSRKKHRL